MAESMHYHISPDLTQDEFEVFQNFIMENSGIFFDDSKIDSLRRALLARTTSMNLRNYNEYYKFLKFNPRGEEEFKELLNLVTISETYFFRDAKHLETLRKYILPKLLEEKRLIGDRGIRIWSAGCATGEEPYSIAVILTEELQNIKDWDIEIFASDVSTNALKIAQSGIYTKWSLRSTDRSYIKKYFTLENEHHRYRLNDEIKRMVKFEYFNLIKEPFPLSKMGNYWDIIFCKNVTIYFKRDSTKRVIHDFFNSLRDGGILFVGLAESLYQISNEFQLVEMGGSFIYKKEKEEIIKPPYLLPSYPKRKIDVFSPFSSTQMKRRTIVERQTSIEQPEKPKEKEDVLELYKKAEYYFEENQFDRALLELMKIVKTVDNHPETHLMIADIYANDKRYDAAEEECRKAIAINSILTSAHFLLGVVLHKQDKIEEAISELKKTIFLEPNLSMAHINLAKIYHEMHAYKKALKSYYVALKILEETASVKDGSKGIPRDELIKICQEEIEKIKGVEG